MRWVQDTYSIKLRVEHDGDEEPDIDEAFGGETTESEPEEIESMSEGDFDGGDLVEEEAEEEEPEPEPAPKPKPKPKKKNKKPPKKAEPEPDPVEEDEPEDTADVPEPEDEDIDLDDLLNG
jgi:hypothetical protein